MDFLIKENLKRVLHEIKNHPDYRDNVKLVAVSKKQSITKMLAAVAAGQLDFGENYVQEARDKKLQLPPTVRLHLIGPLQKNKAKYCPQIFSSIHSLCRLDVAKVLQQKCAVLEQDLTVLIQMNLNDEPTKSGLTSYDDLLRFVEQLTEFKRLKLAGLMTIPDPSLNEQQTADIYRQLRKYLTKLQTACQQDYDLKELSMGMSQDYRIALAEGATFIRIGTAIFGERD